jgi:hypothetical protein
MHFYLLNLYEGFPKITVTIKPKNIMPKAIPSPP